MKLPPAIWFVRLLGPILARLGQRRLLPASLPTGMPVKELALRRGNILDFSSVQVPRLQVGLIEYLLDLGVALEGGLKAVLGGYCGVDQAGSALEVFEGTVIGGIALPVGGVAKQGRAPTCVIWQAFWVACGGLSAAWKAVGSHLRSWTLRICALEPVLLQATMGDPLAARITRRCARARVGWAAT